MFTPGDKVEYVGPGHGRTECYWGSCSLGWLRLGYSIYFNSAGVVEKTDPFWVYVKFKNHRIENFSRCDLRPARALWRRILSGT